MLVKATTVVTFVDGEKRDTAERKILRKERSRRGGLKKFFRACRRRHAVPTWHPRSQSCQKAPQQHQLHSMQLVFLGRFPWLPWASTLPRHSCRQASRSSSRSPRQPRCPVHDFYQAEQGQEGGAEAWQVFGDAARVVIWSTLSSAVLWRSLAVSAWQWRKRPRRVVHSLFACLVQHLNQRRGATGLA